MLRTIFYTCAVLIATSTPVFAAKLFLEMPTSTSPTGAPVTVQVFVDPEGTPLSAVSGTLSFPSELFDVEYVSTEGSIVSLWVVPPHPTEERTLDARTRIAFEGIVPGGFKGIRSPYYEGFRPGIVFTVTLIPKRQGVARVILDSIELHAHDAEGTLIPSTGVFTQISIPKLSGTYVHPLNSNTETTSNTLTMLVARDPLIANNAWYVYVNEDSSILPLDHIEIAESGEYSIRDVRPSAWRTLVNPYVLSYQSRTKYIHVKAVYTNGTYASKTIPPVENSSMIEVFSRILIGIAVATLLIYRYGKNFLHLTSRTIRTR